MLTLDFSEAQSAFFYNFFLLAAMLAAFALYLREGRRQGFPLTTWLTVLAVVNVALVVGSRLGGFSGADWLAFLSGSTLPDHARKTILGGLVLGLAAYLLLRRQLRLPAAAADVLFLGLPLAALVGRMGCVAAGCCFGTPTDLPWAARFGPSSSVFEWQQAEGLLAPDAVFSLPVHPVQGYFIVGNLLIFSVLLLVRARLRAAGSLALLALALLMFNRFCLEFFREIATNRGLTGLHFWGLKGAQWLALSLSLATLFLFFKNEKRPSGQSATHDGTFRKMPTATAAAWVVGLATFAFLGRRWMSFVEEWLVILAVAPAFACLSWEVFQRRRSRLAYLPAAGLLSVAGLVLVQLPRDSMLPPTLPPLPTAYRKLPDRWFEIGAGLTTGNFKDIERNCDGDIVREQKYRNLSQGTELGYHQLLSDRGDEFAVGLKLSPGGAWTNETTGRVGRQYFAIGPFAQLESRPIGINAGFFYAPEARHSEFYQTDFGREIYFSGGLRLGLRHRYFFDVQYYNQHSFSYFPHPSLSIGILNLGFNDRTHRSHLRFGMALMGSSWSGVLSGRFPFKNPNLTGDVSVFFGNENMISAGLRYRLPMR